MARYTFGMSSQPFNPDPTLAAQIATNRAGKLTRSQRSTILVVVIACSLGLLIVAALFVNVMLAFMSGVPLGNIVGVLFFLFFALSFGYLALTMYFNLRGFLPDALTKQPIKQARGKLEIRMAGRDCPELPYSYIVADYSFAPFVVPYDVPLEVGREYVVYYAAHSRIFLNIEPADSMKK